MRILYFLTQFPAYSETFIQQEINQLEKVGYSVTIVNLSGFNKRQAKSDYTIINNSKNPFKLLWAILKSAFQLKSITLSPNAIYHVVSTIFTSTQSTSKSVYLWLSLDYLKEQVSSDTYHLSILHFLFKSTLAGYLVNRNLSIPFHIRLHTKSSLLSDKTVKRILTEAKEITSISKDTALYYKDKFEVTESIQIVRQSLDLSGLLSVESPSSISGFRILAIGRLVKKKGFNHLIEAIALLNKEQRHSIQVDIYGSGGMKTELLKAINKNDLQHIVKLQGVLSHATLMAELAKADLLVVPSISTEADIDGIPTVIPESMVLKTPVIATAVAGIPELIEDGITGYLVRPESAEELAEKIVALKDNQHLRFAVQEPAFKKVIAEYKSSLANKIEKDIYN